MASKSPAPRKAKRRKLDTSKDDEEISLDKSWQRVGIILDAVIGSVSPQDSYKLVPSLFGLLERYGSDHVRSKVTLLGHCVNISQPLSN